MIGYDFVLSCVNIWLIYYERDTEGTYKYYSDASWTSGVRWRIHESYFEGQETQPQHPHLIDALRFFNTNPQQCTLYRCLCQCDKNCVNRGTTNAYN